MFAGPRYKNLIRLPAGGGVARRQCGKEEKKNLEKRRKEREKESKRKYNKVQEIGADVFVLVFY